MKNVWIIVTLAAFCLIAGVAQAATGEVKSVIALSEVLNSGEFVTGARIEYPGAVKAADLKFDATYKVTGYEIVGTYVNNDGVRDHAEQQGKYVFLKFAHPVPASAKGITQHRYGATNFFWPADVMIRQYQVLTLADGTVVNPAGFAATATVNDLADNCLDLSFTDAKGFKVTYRLYVPKGYESKKADLPALPLVVYWHGGSSPGTNNLPQQREGIPAVLMRADIQNEHPCFVMVPQSVSTVNPGPGVWVLNIGTKEAPLFGPTDSLKASVDAISQVAGQYNIDPRRIYGTGWSQGARAMWMASIMKPDLLAAQLGIASSDVYPDEQVKPLVGKPTWILVSEDDRPDRPGQTGTFVDQLERLGAKVSRKIGNDGFNGYLHGYSAEMQAKAQRDEATAAGATVLYTHYIAGTVMPDPHNAELRTSADDRFIFIAL